MSKQMMTTTVPARFRHAPAVLVLAAAGLLSACTLAPRYEQPVAPVAASFPAPTGAEDPAGAVPAADIAWQSFFGDERLKRLIAMALENNRDLRVSVLNVEKARAQYQIQRAALFPTVDAAAGLSRQTASGTSAATVQQYSYYQATVGATSYELDLFGRVRSLRDVALADYFSQVETRKAAQISLVAAVAQGYFALLSDDELLRITRETLATREDSLKLTQLKFDNGVVSELDLQQARTLVEAARSTLAQLVRARAQDQNALELLLGGPVPTDLPAGVPLARQTALMPAVAAGMPSDLLVRRPDILAAEQTLRGTNANIGAARAAFFPRISLTASIGKASSDLDDLFSSGHVWTFVPQITLPIFTGGQNTANLEAAKVSREIAVAQYEKSIQSAFQEVSDALAGRATYADQLQATQAQLDATQKTFSLSDLRYRSGVASYLDLLDAQRSLFEVQQSEIAAQLALLDNQVTLYKVLGGGWDESQDPTATARAPAN